MRINRHRNMEPTDAERAKRNAELNAAALAYANSLAALSWVWEEQEKPSYGRSPAMAWLDGERSEAIGRQFGLRGMTDQPRILATIDGRSGYDGLTAAMRARIVELNTNYESIEAVTMLPDGYVTKMLSDVPLARDKSKGQLRGLGPLSFGPMLDALGLEVWVVECPTPTMEKLEKRKRPRVDAGADAGVIRRRRVGKIARVRQLLMSSAAKRSMTARIAACARWQKHREKQAKLARRRELRRKLMGAAAGARKP